MRNLLNFLARYNNLIIFLFLEGIAFYMVTHGNNYQNSRVVNGVRGITNGIEKRIYSARSYFNLKEINIGLALENADLKNRLQQLTKKEGQVFFSVNDSLKKQQYVHTFAEVIENTVNKQKNFFTINKGTDQGIRPDMAVTSEMGVAGVIVGCSKNYSVAMSVLNLDFKLSARIKSNGYFGSLSWDGRDYRYAILNEIPQHVIVNVGDTIETTGYSAIFPEGVLVGTVNDYEKYGGDFYKISILLTSDFKRLQFVDVIGNLKKTEQQDLEKLYK